MAADPQTWKRSRWVVGCFHLSGWSVLPDPVEKLRQAVHRPTFSATMGHLDDKVMVAGAVASVHWSCLDQKAHQAKRLSNRIE